MANTTVAVDCLKALEILLQFAAKVALDRVLVLGDDLDDPVQLLIRQRLGADVRADLSLLEDELGPGGPDAVNVREGGFNPLVTGNIDTEKARHGAYFRVLALTLFKAGVFLVNDVDAALPTDNLAVRSAAFDRGANFHVFLSLKKGDLHSEHGDKNASTR
jgi:hypothetical protein